MFVDRVLLELRAGKGGNGVVAWRREKFIPKGGPCGGNGGKGGDVILKADTQVASLDWFRNRRLLRADNGQQGGSNNCSGKNGSDLTLTVPCGTLVRNVDTGEILADLTEEGQTWIACKGGKGGRGNDSFKSSVNRAPNTCTPGKEGDLLRIELELKLIADVGLVGFPNAGKSTLIEAVSKARVKIAAYPFTTLHPNLGHIQTDDYRRILVADIPGIIEGAHENRGLGFEFLRHIERTKLLIFVLDASGIDGRDPIGDYLILRAELEAYNPNLLLRPFLVVLNKIDVPEAEENIKAFTKKFKLPKGKLFKISAATGEGVAALVNQVISQG
ncbi:MAG: GTPase ObgE [Chlamydiales bacterium]|nr:GTPase ObgE [Chlamydiales bacterium]